MPVLAGLLSCGQVYAMDFASQTLVSEKRYEQLDNYGRFDQVENLLDGKSTNISLRQKFDGNLRGSIKDDPYKYDFKKQPMGSSNGGVFNSVAIAFSGIASQSRWLTVLSSLNKANLFACGNSVQCEINKNEISNVLNNAGNLGFSQKLAYINRQINNLISYESDRSIYGKEDYWALPQESLQTSRGDCEDYVILKFALLKKLGVPARSMSMVVLKDTARNLYHAVLAVSTNKGRFILDNVHNNVLLDKQLAHYLPLYSFSENRSWIHGRRILDKQYLAKSKPNYEFSNIRPGESASAIQLVLQGVSMADLADLRPTISN